MKRKLTMKEWRKVMDLTQAEVAQKLNIHPNTYREYEEHPERVRIGTIICFCNMLGIKTSEIDMGV